MSQTRVATAALRRGGFGAQARVATTTPQRGRFGAQGRVAAAARLRDRFGAPGCQERRRQHKKSLQGDGRTSL